MTIATSIRITKTPGVYGGRARISGYRIPAWGPIRFRQLELSNAEIHKAYPSITTAGRDAAWKYYASNRDEVDREARENEDDSPAA